MIPVNTPSLSGNEARYLQECIETGWISSDGPFVNRFELEFGDYIGRKHALAVSNGSAALDIALKAIGLEPGDEVIMPTFTIISPAFSILRQNAVPVLVDSDPDTWNMDVSAIQKRITCRTKAILVVHIYGLPCDMDPILDIAREFKLKVIEDAAEMHGQTYKGKKCGTFGDVSIFSFYPNKHITTGEGGMVLTDNTEIADKCAKYRNLSFEPGKRRFVHYEMGWNYRMTNMQAAIGVAQLERIEKTILRKRQIGKLYNQLLKPLISVIKPPLESTDFADNIYWVYGLLAENAEMCEKICSSLAEYNTGTRPFFWCMHEQPLFINMGLFKGESYPIAEKLARNGFYIPSGLGITDDEIRTVANQLKTIVAHEL